MATKARKIGKPAQKSPRSRGNADAKLDSLERMTWIEQGGIDLRDARKTALAAKVKRGRKG